MSFYNKSASIQSHSPGIALRSRRSLTFCALQVEPKKSHTKNLDDIQQEILKNHQSINGIIVRFKEVVSERLEAQELELLIMFKSTIDKMMSEIGEVVARYRQAVEEVEVASLVNKLQNELTYFKTEALELFQLNQDYKKEVQTLKKHIFDLKLDNETNKKIILKLTKKVLRSRDRQESILTEPDKQTEPSLPFVTHHSSHRVVKIKPSDRRNTLTSVPGKVC